MTVYNIAEILCAGDHLLLRVPLKLLLQPGI